ncbi:glycosyltransferase [Actinoplanes sp. CA-054009]
MNIIIVTDELDALGGIHTVIHTLAQHLTRRGHHVHTVGLYRAASPVEADGPVTYVRTVLDAPTPAAAPQPARLRSAKQRLQQLLTTTAPGVLIMSSVHVSLWLNGLNTESHLRIGHYHGSYDYARTHYHLQVITDLWAHFDHCVFLSPDDATRFATHAALRTSWIPNPLPAGHRNTGPVPGHRPSLRRVLAVGRLTPSKRFDLAIDAFAQARLPGWRLHIIGDGDQLIPLRHHAENRLGTIGGDSPVVFPGRIAPAAMPAEYLAADVLAVTSEHEGFGMVIAEAATAGVPAVAFDVSGGIRSLIGHNHTGMLVPPGDVDAFAQALHAVIADPSRRARLGAAAACSTRNLTPEVITDRWEQLFTSLIAGQLESTPWAS